MNRTPVRPSNIASAGYENGTLEIAFFNGGVCQYFNVSKHIDYVIPVRGYSIDVVVFHDYGWAEGVKRAVHDDVMPLAESHDQLPNMWWCRLAKKP